jgi:hypothetical protein
MTRKRIKLAIDNLDALLLYEPDLIQPTYTLLYIRCSNYKSTSRTCDEKPYKRCINTNRPYIVRVDENTLIRYYPKGYSRPKYTKEDSKLIDYYFTYNRRSRYGYKNFYSDSTYPYRLYTLFSKLG